MLPKTDQLMFRQVCKPWRDISLATWRSSKILKLSYDQSNFLLNNTMTIKELTRQWKFTCSFKPFKHLYLKFWQFGHSVESTGSKEEVDAFNQFWQLMGPNLDILTLEDCMLSCSSDILNVIHQFCPELGTLRLTLPRPTYFAYGKVYPTGNCHGQRSTTNSKPKPLSAFLEHSNLTSIYFFNSDNRLNYSSSLLKIHWLELFSNFPRLKIINSELTKHSLRQFVKQLESIKQLHSTYSPAGMLINTCALFNVHCKSDTLLLGRLHGKGIGLQTLNLRVYWDPNDAHDRAENNLENIIKSNASVLTTLKLQLYRMDLLVPSWNCLAGMRLNCLKELYLGSDSFCWNLQFLKHTPNLKILEIDYAKEAKTGERTHLVANTPETEMENVKLLKLSKFKLEYSVTDDDVEKLVKWMPNVQELEIFVRYGNYCEYYVVLCEGWKGLRVQLTIRLHQLLANQALLQGNLG